ncbi:MAG: hypothetical protein KKA73_13635 [Chloroflexi bacterium]|nr:hypothetical protein [Chloroflexota bacterium]
MTDQPDLRFVFLDVALFEEGAAMRGGALITDIETKPYEFRCTSPVRPTSLQRVLYGDTLEEYIYVQLIGVPLVKDAKEKPGLILVRHPMLLRIRPFLSYPVVLVRSDQKATMATSEIGSGDLKPIVISSHREFPSEANAAQAQLALLMQRRDLLEPFERVQVALSEVHKQRVGDGIEAIAQPAESANTSGRGRGKG